mmetsp:Transcript_5001/g.9721  ORF Transcript_5001/g.9721 Transcript_5001/m.9721 type:complete len:274 (+) Transcript_5001:129-950(+)
MKKIGVSLIEHIGPELGVLCHHHRLLRNEVFRQLQAVDLGRVPHEVAQDKREAGEEKIGLRDRSPTSVQVRLEGVGVEASVRRLPRRAPLIAELLLGDAGLRARESIEDDVTRARADRHRIHLRHRASDACRKRLGGERQQVDVLGVPVALHLAVALRPTAALRRRARVVLLARSVVLGLTLEVGALRLELLDRGEVRTASGGLGVHPPRVEERRVRNRQRLFGLPVLVEQLVHLSQRSYRVPLLVRLPSAEHVDDILRRDRLKDVQELRAPE